MEEVHVFQVADTVMSCVFVGRQVLRPRDEREVKVASSPMAVMVIGSGTCFHGCRWVCVRVVARV